MYFLNKSFIARICLFIIKVISIIFKDKPNLTNVEEFTYLFQIFQIQ